MYTWVCAITVLCSFQIATDENEIRRVFGDRIVSLVDAGSLDRAAATARVAAKKFRGEALFRDLLHKVDYRRAQQKTALTNRTLPNEICSDRYHVNWIKGLEDAARAQEIHELAETLKASIDPDSWIDGRSIMLEYSSNSFLLICTSKENHQKIRELLQEISAQKEE